MGTRECLHRQLTTSRGYTEAMLADFKTPEQWTHQVHPQANHALWFVGHMGVSDNFFASVIAPERTVKQPRYDECFGMGSQPQADPAAYPPIEEVLAFMRERRQNLLDIFEGLSEAELDHPTPKELHSFCKTWGGVFEMAVWHEGLHSGQVSVARRALGHHPVLNAS